MRALACYLRVRWLVPFESCVHVFVKNFSRFSVALCGATCYNTCKQGAIARRLQVERGNTMAALVYEGSHVTETFASSFETLVAGITRANEFVHFSLNVQDGLNVNFSCLSGSASEYIAFVDALRLELSKHDTALVVAYDYRHSNDETTVFIVCGNE